MRRIANVKPLQGYRLELAFDDGITGIVDLSHLAGQGVFAAWKDSQVFEQVRIGSSGEIAWGDRIDLCPDALYLEVTGKKPEDLFPSLRTESSHA